jgi:hypothetical protein
MKNNLYLTRLSVAILITIQCNVAANSQTLLIENFSGFSAGSHRTPYTIDASATLDSKTAIPGWAGSKIYPAGGEIKVGTSTATGWIETPSINFSANGGDFKVTLDICRWTKEPATLQIFLNGTAVGNVITPTDSFQLIQIDGTCSTGTGKIKIMALTNRFFLDSIAISSSVVTLDKLINEKLSYITVFPVPVADELIVSNIKDYGTIEIIDLNGKIVKLIQYEDLSEIRICVRSLNQGIYFIRVTCANQTIVRKFIKY